MFDQIILLCRPGFEKECAGEIMQQATLNQFPAYVQTNDQTGVVALISSSEQNAKELISKINFRQLIFTRQWLAADKKIVELPETNRLTVLLEVVKSFEDNFHDIEMDYADTNEGKSLSKFCKQFKPHLINALKKNHLLSAHSRWRLHLFFTDSLHVTIGLSPIDNSATDNMGIIRLKMPGKAPSRSTLKMEEAIHWFLPVTQHQTNQNKGLIKAGMTVVDLGAAPGGWTWQFVQRECHVIAIDNGPMDDELMKTGMVEHLRTDAFTYTPDKKVDWLICDMAERPLHVSRLIARWLAEGRCCNTIFNLKLPMKKRLLNAQECIALLDKSLSQAKIKYSIQAKQLYHDREEITVCILQHSE